MAKIDDIAECSIKASKPLTLDKYNEYDTQQSIVLQEPKSGDHLTVATWLARKVRDAQKTMLVLSYDGKDFYHTKHETDSFTYPFSGVESFLSFPETARVIKSPEAVGRFLNHVLECKDIKGDPVLPEAVPIKAMDFKKMFDEQQARGNTR